MDNAASRHEETPVLSTGASVSRMSDSYTSTDAGVLNAESHSSETDGVRIIIPSNTEFVRVVRLAVLGVVSRMSFTFEDIEDIKLAVSEACNNAILHAKAATNYGRNSPVEITVTPYPDRIEIAVADGGYVPPPGLQPRSSHRSPSEGDELRESGLGLFLMQTLMDEVEHQTSAESSTIVRMVKFLPQATRHETAIPDTQQPVGDASDSSSGTYNSDRKTGSSTGT